MIYDNTLWLYLLLIANVVLVGAAALAIACGQRELRRTRQFWASPTAAALGGDAYDDRSLRRMIDQRFLALQGHLERLPPRAAATNVTLQPAPVSGSIPFDHATRMARSGASIDDLVRGCGLNRGEAELMLRLHSRNSPAASAATH